MRAEEKFRAGQGASFSSIYDAGVEKPGSPSKVTSEDTNAALRAQNQKYKFGKVKQVSS